MGADANNMLHCPFCGYNDTVTAIMDGGLGRHATVTCNICGVSVAGLGVLIGDVPDDELTASAVQAWNTRTDPVQDEGEHLA